MHQLSPDDYSVEPSDSDMILAEVVALLGRKDYQVRGLAFEMLYKYYQQPIERYLATRVNDQEYARDLRQETFKRVWDCFLRLDKPLPQTAYHLRNWLYTTAKHIAIDAHRHNKLYDIIALPDKEYELAVEGEEDRNVERLLAQGLLQEALVEMPPKYREAFLLRYYHGYSEHEAAVKLGVKEKTVSSNASRGREHLNRKYYQVIFDFRVADAKEAIRRSGQSRIYLPFYYSDTWPEDHYIVCQAEVLLGLSAPEFTRKVLEHGIDWSATIRGYEYRWS